MDIELLDGYTYSIEIHAEKDEVGAWKVTGTVKEGKRYIDAGSWIQKDASLSVTNSDFNDAMNEVAVNLSIYLESIDGDLFYNDNLLQ